jgi:hypothetical protein
MQIFYFRDSEEAREKMNRGNMSNLVHVTRDWELKAMENGSQEVSKFLLDCKLLSFDFFYTIVLVRRWVQIF